jgi:hypothetical protein
MFNRYAVLLVAGAALALDASTVTAQVKKKPTSSKRIPISKEPPPAPRVDTVTVYRTDTLRMEGRVDTLRLTGPTVTVHDTVIQTVDLRTRHIGGMYLGLGAGPTLPYGSIRSVNQPGAMGQLQVGYQGLNNPLGFRLDGTFTQYAHDAQYAFMGDHPHVWNLNLDAKLQLPVFGHTLGSAVLFMPYVIGGGSWLYYNNLRVKLDEGSALIGVPPANVVLAGNDDSYHSAWGWNAGVGLGFHAGKKEMFAEARWVHFTPDNDLANTNVGSAWHIPITFGVNFF